MGENRCSTGLGRREAEGAGPASSRLFFTPDEDELRAACTAALRRRALLVDLERLAVRTAAHLLHARLGEEGGEGATQLGAAIDAALREIEIADREAERRADLERDPWDGDHAFLIHAFGIPPLAARAAALEFNALPESARQAFFRVVLSQGSDGEEGYPSDEEGSDRMASLVRQALRALFLVGRSEKRRPLP